MLASSFGSVSSILRRTSANDRSDEIFTYSTAMVRDPRIAGALVSVICDLLIVGPRRRQHSRLRIAGQTRLEKSELGCLNVNSRADFETRDCNLRSLLLRN